MTDQRKHIALKILLNTFIWLLITFAFHYILKQFNRPDNHLRLFKGLVFLATIFYLNFYVFVPKFISRRKLKHYAIAAIGTLAVIFVTNYYIELLFKDALSLSPPVLQYGTTNEWTTSSTKPFIINLGMVLLCIVSLAISTSIRVTREWFKNENQLKEIENKKLLAELSYLKAQINPHFFFNTLNGIYALARQKSNKTPEVILMLSVLMRYIIYESSAPKVQLKKELAHISNFIDLQKLRLSEIVKIDFRVSGNPKGITIEPLLFSVLVENAFKHGIDYSKKNTIKIHLDIKDELLHFIVSNPMMAQTKKINKFEQKDSGIGLDNIKKRLELLYPNKHEMTVYEDQSLYTVELSLILKEKKHEVHHY